MSAKNFQILPQILQQHVEEAGFLWILRANAISDPHYSLSDLAHLDSRVEGHLDGLRNQRDSAWRFCGEALQSQEAGEAFVAAILATEGSDGEKLTQVLEIVSKSSDAQRGFISALGWVDHEHADKWMLSLLQSKEPAIQRAAIAGLAIRREGMSREIDWALQCEDAPTRARALRAVGETKYRTALSALSSHQQSDDEACRFWATWSAVVLGDPESADRLKSFVDSGSPFALRAMQLAPHVLDPANCQQWLRSLAQNDATRRHALKGCGVIGDPIYIPTLISQMSNPEHARVAGEAFSVITGIDLAYDDLDTDWPEGFEAGPTEEPEDENVELDADEDLPWPDQALIQEWWNRNGGAFQQGQRYLCGEIISEANCRRVLIEGFQRQRIAAALELALMNPDEPLFEWRAPGFRQQEWLGLRKPRRRAS